MGRKINQYCFGIVFSGKLQPSQVICFYSGKLQPSQVVRTPRSSRCKIRSLRKTVCADDIPRFYRVM